ncbi:MAG TPA: transglutaminase family protein [Opitutaceae bacterium]|nr:transglutaminase family protein [Opitutaceae bacterium]
MPSSFEPSPANLLTVRIGCAFTYQAFQSVPALLNFKPRRGKGQSLVEEKLTIGNHLPSEEFEDRHGNILYRVVLEPGQNEIRHDAIVAIEPYPDNHGFGPGKAISPAEVPLDLLRYTLPSRYCDSDKLLNFAQQQFGAVEPGQAQVQAVCDWVHQNIEYRFGSGSPDLSAWDVLQRRHGVCRDFAHLTVALCRALNLPARYVTCHLPDIGFLDPASPMDFHAYTEVYLGGKWYAYDARFNLPRIGRIKVSCGYDAVDCAFATVFGPAQMTAFEVWAYQVPPGEVSVGEPIDLSKRLDGTLEIRGLRTGT